jgi:adenosine deaminase
MKAVTDQNLGYPALKMMARTSLQHAFVDGAPLWRTLSSLTPVAECTPSAGGMEGARCRRFVRGSPKAMLQWRLERDFARFEAQVGQSARDTRAN